MEEEGKDYFYFLDDLGSPMRLMDEAGRSEETYGFDEFGNDIRTAKDIFQDSMQSFGFTGYQMDSAGGLYFAQARRYDAGAGRFVSEDFLKGHIAVPYTMNHYNYCWNRPMDLVDLNGMWPSLSDIGNGIKKTVGKIATGINNFYEEHKETIDTIAKIVGTVATVTAIGVIAAGAVTACMATGGAAGVAIIAAVGTGAGIGGFSGGIANVTTGGSFINGFVGGAINGAITTAITCISPATVFGANLIGGSIGTAITETLNGYDDPKNANSALKVATLSVVGGVTQATVGISGENIGKAAGVEDEKLANSLWNGFSNLLSFSIGEVSYVSTDAGYEAMIENYEKE